MANSTFEKILLNEKESEIKKNNLKIDRYFEQIKILKGEIEILKKEENLDKKLISDLNKQIDLYHEKIFSLNYKINILMNEIFVMTH